MRAPIGSVVSVEVGVAVVVAGMVGRLERICVDVPDITIVSASVEPCTSVVVTVEVVPPTITSGVEEVVDELVAEIVDTVGT